MPKISVSQNHDLTSGRRGSTKCFCLQLKSPCLSLQIYLGDHMTRAWVKDGEDQEVTGQKITERRRPSVKCAHKQANESNNEHFNSKM